MSSAGIGRFAPWVAVALLGAIAGLLFAMFLAALEDSPAVLVRAGVADSEAAAVAQSQGATPAPLTAVEQSTNNPPDGGPVVSAGLAGPPPSEGVGETVVRTAGGLVLSIPSLSVSAEIVDLGFTPEGVLDVPSSGESVGWYDVSSRPGEPGNALLGGHFDWDGSLAVFWRLSELSEGDRVELDDGSGVALVYEVQSTSNVDWDRPLNEILASDDGSSLTLFTCGGEFDQARGEYAQRVVVWATLVEPSPLASRPAR